MHGHILLGLVAVYSYLSAFLVRGQCIALLFPIWLLAFELWPAVVFEIGSQLQ